MSKNDLTTPHLAVPTLRSTKLSAEMHPRPASAPAVDIFEDADAITLLADMPGIARDTLDVHLDGDALTLEGEANINMPDGIRALCSEVNVPRYRRTFTLSWELDSSRIRANVKNAVLTLRIPKQAHAQPRRIAVQQAGAATAGNTPVQIVIAL